MSTAPSDTREVILATIRGRLLDDDVNTLRFDPDVYERHTWSIAEHALDAALARGASLAEVAAAAAGELADVHVDGLVHVDARAATDDLFDERLEHLDVPLEQSRRAHTTWLLGVLVIALSLRAGRRVRDAVFARVRERGLDPSRTLTGEVLEDEERVALYTAGLYGEGAPAA